jgi:hypothetical protein
MLKRDKGVPFNSCLRLVLIFLVGMPLLSILFTLTYIFSSYFFLVITHKCCSIRIEALSKAKGPQPFYKTTQDSCKFSRVLEYCKSWFSGIEMLNLQQ